MNTPIGECKRNQLTKTILKKPGCRNASPYSAIHGANMGPTWVLSAPDGPRVVPMNLAIRDTNHCIRVILATAEQTWCERNVGSLTCINFNTNLIGYLETTNIGMNITKQISLILTSILSKKL